MPLGQEQAAALDAGIRASGDGLSPYKGPNGLGNSVARYREQPGRVHGVVGAAAVLVAALARSSESGIGYPGAGRVGLAGSGARRGRLGTRWDPIRTKVSAWSAAIGMASR